MAILAASLLLTCGDITTSFRDETLTIYQMQHDGVYIVEFTGSGQGTGIAMGDSVDQTWCGTIHGNEEILYYSLALDGNQPESYAELTSYTCDSWDLYKQSRLEWREKSFLLDVHIICDGETIVESGTLTCETNGTVVIRLCPWVSTHSNAFTRYVALERGGHVEVGTTDDDDSSQVFFEPLAWISQHNPKTGYGVTTVFDAMAEPDEGLIWDRSADNKRYWRQQRWESPIDQGWEFSWTVTRTPKCQAVWPIPEEPSSPLGMTPLP